MKCCHDLRQGLVDRSGQLDAVVLVDADQCITGRSCWAMTALVSSQEPDDRCEFLRMLREEGRGLDRFSAHGSSPPYLNEVKLFSERSNSIPKGGAGPAPHPEVAPRCLPTQLPKGATQATKLVNGFVNAT